MHTCRKAGPHEALNPKKFKAFLMLIISDRGTGFVPETRGVNG